MRADALVHRGVRSGGPLTERPYEVRRTPLPRSGSPARSPAPAAPHRPEPGTIALIRVGDLWRNRAPGAERGLMAEHLRYVRQWSDHREATLWGTVVGPDDRPGADDLVGFVVFGCPPDRVTEVARPGAAARSGLVHADLYRWYPYPT